jgi:hypothetical protein
MIKIKATQGNMLALTEMITAIITIFLYLLFVDFSSERFVLIVLPFGFLIILLLFYLDAGSFRVANVLNITKTGEQALIHYNFDYGSLSN